MNGVVAMHGGHVEARHDGRGGATLDALVPLVYAERTCDALPAYVRSASAVRRFRGELVIVQDDVDALAVCDERGAVRPVLLPPRPSGARVFDDTLGNKHEKLDLEACVTLPDGRLVVFGSGSLPRRECVVVWNGTAPPGVVAAGAFYRAVSAAVPQGGARLNIEGAVVAGGALLLFHRGNDTRDGERTPRNAIVAVDASEFAQWLDGSYPEPRISSVTTVDLGAARGVPYGFTDAVALDDGRIVVLACAEDSTSALSDGAVLGCRVGLLDDSGLACVDVLDAAGEPTTLKLEGIERRLNSSSEFDVAVDVDRPASPACLGRLVWNVH